MFIQTFLHGNPTCSVNDNKLILNASIKYNLEIKRLGGLIFKVKESWSMLICQNGITSASFFIINLFIFTIIIIIAVIIIINLSSLS